MLQSSDVSESKKLKDATYSATTALGGTNLRNESESTEKEIIEQDVEGNKSQNIDAAGSLKRKI